MSQDAYALDMNWPALLQGIGVRVVDVLRRAELPDDLFARSSSRLEALEYYRLWEAIEAESGDATFPLRILRSLRSESFSPPLFAALCSANLSTALSRLSRYKPLVGPMRLDVVEQRDEVVVHLHFRAAVREPPPTLAAAELLFLVSLARMGTHEDVRPSRVTMKTPPSRRGDYEKFAGATIRAGKGNCVAFHRVDAERLRARAASAARDARRLRHDGAASPGDAAGGAARRESLDGGRGSATRHEQAHAAAAPRRGRDVVPGRPS